MNKLTRKQIAAAFLQLSSTESHTKAIRALAAYLIQQRRTRELDLVLNDIALLVQQKYGRVYAKVTSAHVVDESLRHNLVSLIKQLSKASAVEVSPALDPDLISGVKIETPQFQLDLSVRAKLNQLRAA